MNEIIEHLFTPAIASVTGMGMIFLYTIGGVNVMVSLLIGLYATSLTTLLINERGDKDE